MIETIEIPAELARFELPDGLQARLAYLLDRQDSGEGLAPEERSEAEGLVELAEFLSLLRLRAKQVAQRSCKPDIPPRRAQDCMMPSGVDAAAEER